MSRFPILLLCSLLLTGCFQQQVKPSKSQINAEILQGLYPTTIQEDPAAVLDHLLSKGLKDIQLSYSPLPASLPAVSDVWHRIPAGFTILKHVNPKRFKRTLNRYRKAQRYFNRLSKKAKPYLHHIVEAVAQRGMPMEIALLPAIESNFTPYAVSPYRAVGLWQIIPSTGRSFGLKQNAWYDGRRDVIASTNAALDYLEFLYEYFNNNWLHAIAAYNCGEGCVGRAIAKNRARGLPTDYWSLPLPKETKQYIPRLMALSAVVKNPKAYGVTLPKIDNSPYLVSVPIEGQIDLRKAAKAAGLTQSSLKKLNTGFKHWITDPKGPHRLLLPLLNANLLQQSMLSENIYVSMKRPPYRSKKYRSKKRNKKYRSKKRNKKYRSKKRSKKRQHKIGKGDTLYRLSKRYSVTIRSLSRANGISAKTSLKVGQRLTIPSGKYKKQYQKKRVAKRSYKIKHKVRKGDTLASLAGRYRTSIKSICRINRISKRTTLHIGRVLRIPSL